MRVQSDFFHVLPVEDKNLPSSFEPLPASGTEWSRLFLCREGGRSRVYKTLAEEYVGNPLYEGLLRKEFEIGFSVMHPHICELYAFRQIEGLGNAIEMEWIEGRTLAELLQQGPLPGTLVVKVLDEICDALDYLHHKQIWHRDLKPENIMITAKGNNVKLIDFGCSDSDGHYTGKGGSGTRGYAAPELVAGGPVDGRADIYSLGVMLRELAPRYHKIADRCTASDPGKRYPDVKAFRDAIHRADKRRRIIPAALVTALLAAALATALVLTGRENNLRKIDRIIHDTESEIEAVMTVSLPA